ncbi:hypothetical protein ACHAXR_007180 [Thalassiosira sp. AJA248-18]
MTVPRQRRNNAWQTPLPLRSPSKRAASASKTSGSMLCLSLLSIALIIVGVIFFTTFHSAALHGNGTAPFYGRRHVPASLNPQSRGLHETHSIKYVNLPEIQSSSHHYDVIVVGCGPAGLTSALFSSRMGMSVLVIGSPSSGSLSGTSQIDNFPSFFGHDRGGGQGWIDATMDQASYFGTQFAHPTLLATGLVKTKVQGTSFEVILGTDTPTKVLGKTVIIASGSVPRKLNLPHEATLWGHSLHNCALCDGDLYVRDGSKKSVAVIGGGDAAVEAIFLLHKLGVDTIHWIHRRQEFRASQLEVERVQSLPNVEVWTPFVVAEWMVKEKDDARAEDDPAPLSLQGIRIVGARNGVADSEATSSLTIPCDGAFLMIGSTPNSNWLKESDIDIDPVSNLIRLAQSLDSAESDNNDEPQFPTSTSIRGVFAAGEVTDDVYRQALTASSEGAKSAIDAQRYLRHIGMETSVSAHSSQAVKNQEDTTKKEPKMPKINQPERESKGSVDCDLTKPDCIKLVVSKHPVVVFSKSYCPYCRRALEALRSFTDPLVIDLTEVKDGFHVQDALAGMTGRRTVPNVFVGGSSIGGGDETTALYREGKLEGLLRKAGAIQ